MILISKIWFFFQNRFGDFGSLITPNFGILAKKNPAAALDEVEYSLLSSKHYGH